MPTFLAVILAILGTVFTGATLWVGWQNMQMARVKLHHDLYERRYKVFRAAEKLLQSAINKTDDLTMHEDYSPYWIAIGDAPFIFPDPSLMDFLKTLDKQVITVSAVAKRLRASPGDPDLSERELQLKMEVMNFLSALHVRFLPYLAEPKIKTVPAWVERTGRCLGPYWRPIWHPVAKWAKSWCRDA